MKLGFMHMQNLFNHVTDRITDEKMFSLWPAPPTTEVVPLQRSENLPSLVDEERFGWWIGTASAEPLRAEGGETTSSEGSLIPTNIGLTVAAVETKDYDYPMAETSSTTNTSSCLDDDDDDDDDDALFLDDTRGLDQSHILDKDGDGDEQIELDRLDSGFDESSNGRHTLCYTPDRMVKCEEFRILTPSPKFFSPLQNLITHKTDLDDKGIEVASHLASLLLDSRRNYCRQCCNVRYGDGEVLVHAHHRDHCRTAAEGRSEEDKKDRFVRLQVSGFAPYTEFGSSYDFRRRLDETISSDGCSKQDSQELADDTSGVSSTECTTRTAHEDEWSYVEEVRLRPGELSDESNYVSLEYPADFTSIKEKSTEISEVVSILAELENNPTRAETLLLEDDRFKSSHSTHDYYERLALSIEPEDRTYFNYSKDHPDDELELLYNKVARLQSSGKEIWEEIQSLRRSFSKDEYKLNHLSEDINKFKNEFHELKYLDDLLNLLKGELQNISKRNWPFAIGHKSYETDEVNLVI